MKAQSILLIIAFFVSITGLNAQDKTETNSESLELPGDNLDLYATLDLFQKSKTIEEFEASLNDEETKINNLDLNLDGDVDFIKVVTQKDGDDFSFILQVDIVKDETQDVAVILIIKDKEEKVSIQMIGDKDLYGKDYIIEPKLSTPTVTANPAYSGPDTLVVKSEPATVVVIESEPIVHYVYSPVYVPYYPPYYYGYYPPYYRPYPVVSFHIYFGHHHHHHNHYHGGHRGGGNTVIINNSKTYNNYNRKTSNTVNRNASNGSYKNKSVAKAPSTTGKSKGANVKNKNTHKTPSKQSKSNVNKKNNYSSPSNKSHVKPSNRPSSRPAKRPTSRPQGRRR